MNKPYGSDNLVNLIAPADKRETLLKEAEELTAITVHDRFLADCKMLAIGGFTPLTGFMNSEQVDSVVKNMRLPNGLLWGIPIILLVEDDQAGKVSESDRVALKDEDGQIIAIMDIEEKFSYPKDEFCKNVFKTDDMNHPGVKTIMESPDNFLAGGITLLNRPKRINIDEKYYKDPAETRAEFEKRGWNTVVAFQTRNPIHRAHEYLIKCAMEPLDGVLIHPLVGETKPDDIPADVRMECYEVIIKNYFNPDRVVLSVLPTFMRYAGPREAINHAIMRKNYGCTHFIVGRDHAGVGDYYGTYEAQELLAENAEEIGITPLKFEHAFFCTQCESVISSKTCPHSKENHIFLSGTKVRKMLKEGERPPLEFSRKEVVDVLIKWATGN